MNPCPFVSLFLSIVHQLDFTPSGCNAAGPWQFSVQCEVAYMSKLKLKAGGEAISPLRSGTFSRHTALI